MDKEIGHLSGARPGGDKDDKRWYESWQLLLEYAPLLGLDYLRAARERLPDTAFLAGAQRGTTERHDPRVEKRVDTIAELLKKPRADSVWRAALERPYKELVVLLPLRHQTLRQQRDLIAAHFLSRARRARRAASFNEARTFIEAGRFFHPGFPPYDMEILALTQAEVDLRAQRDAERVAARIISMQADFLGKAETNQIQEAKVLLAELRTLGLAPDDPFLAEQAPRALADAYARLAATRATREDFASAVSLARAGLDQWPDHTELGARLAGYEIALESQRFQDALKSRLASPEPLDVPATARDLARLQARYPNRFAEMASELAALRSQALLAEARTVRPIGHQMRAQLAAFDALFPSRRGQLAGLLAGVAEERLRALEPASAEDFEALQPVIDNIAALPPAERARLRRSLAETVAAAARRRAAEDPQTARSLLSAARARLEEQPVLVNAARALPLTPLLEARTHLEAGRLNAAARALIDAETQDPRHPDLIELRGALDDAMQRARRAYASYVSDINGAQARDQRQFDRRFAGIAASWRDNPEFQKLRIRAPRQGECHHGLAGYGAQAGGSCYDLVAERKGPEMVVIPAGGGLDKAYAIGKYEISVVEFNHYCERSGHCSPRENAGRRLPITDVSAAEAQAYAQWLSQEASRQSGHRVTYRLPTATEWRHAAMADGQQPAQQFNCRVLSAGEVIAGHNLIGVRSGKQNGWGLANYAGNARELVRSGESLSVRGGAYNDPLTECGPEFDAPHSGEADPLTGFRLLRELG